MAVAVGVLAACGGSGGSGDPGGGSASSAAGGSPIKVGTIQTVSGAFGLKILGQIGDVWVKWTNAHGGINGHPVELFNLDDGTNPALGLSDTQQLIVQDHVMAIIGSSAVSSPNIVSYADAKGVPVIGAVTAENVPGQYSFSVGNSLAYSGFAVQDVLKQEKFTKVGVFSCVESASCSSAVTALKTALKGTDASLVGTQEVSSTAPDYIAPCRGMIGSGAQLVQLSLSGLVAQQIVDTCVQQGAKFAWITNSGTAVPSWAKDSGLANAPIYIANDVWPLSEKDTQAQRDFFAAIKEYQPSMLTDPTFGAYVQGVWAGMQMFATVAKAGDIGPQSTPADVLKALYAVKDETLGGLVGPVTYTPGATHVNKCLFVTLLKGGAYSAPFGTGAQCAA